MCDDMFHDRSGPGVCLRAQAPLCGLWLAIGALTVLFMCGGIAQAADMSLPSLHSPPVVRLNLSEAMALFLKQNLDLLIAKYGIESNKGQQITARLFPNPVL